MININGWSAVMGENPSQPDVFQLIDPYKSKLPLT